MVVINVRVPELVVCVEVTEYYRVFLSEQVCDSWLEAWRTTADGGMYTLVTYNSPVVMAILMR